MEWDNEPNCAIQEDLDWAPNKVAESLTLKKSGAGSGTPYHRPSDHVVYSHTQTQSGTGLVWMAKWAASSQTSLSVVKKPGRTSKS